MREEGRGERNHALYPQLQHRAHHIRPRRCMNCRTCSRRSRSRGTSRRSSTSCHLARCSRRWSSRCWCQLRRSFRTTLETKTPDTMGPPATVMCCATGRERTAKGGEVLRVTYRSLQLRCTCHSLRCRCKCLTGTCPTTTFLQLTCTLRCWIQCRSPQHRRRRTNLAHDISTAHVRSN